MTRECAESTCTTLLSRYNRGIRCWAHTLDRVQAEWGHRLTDDEFADYLSGAWLGETA